MPSSVFRPSRLIVEQVLRIGIVYGDNGVCSIPFSAMLRSLM